MKLKSDIRLETLYKVDNLIIPLEPKEIAGIEDAIPNYSKLHAGDEIEISIKKKKGRSLDANAYFWQLCGKIAAKEFKGRRTVYRELIKAAGYYTMCLVEDKAVEGALEHHRNSGLGNIAEVCYKSQKNPGSTAIIFYYGSSGYSKEEMKRLIDETVKRANALGIETMTPAETEALMKLYNL